MRNHRELPGLEKRTDALPNELRLGDVLTFFAVQRCGSLTGAARQLNVTPSQISKAISRLETQLNLQLLRRSIRGVTVTDVGLRVLPSLEQIVSRLRDVVNVESEPGSQPLTVAGPSYLMTMLLPIVASALPDVRLVGLELPPAMVRAQVAGNLFDVALVTGRPNLPPAWQNTVVGEIRKGLMARPSLARTLGATPLRESRVLDVPFITPVYLVNGQFVQVDDDCPVSHARRRQGHKVQTLISALELASNVDQLVFGPVAAARHHFDEGRLVELPVKGWRVTDPLNFACNPERLLAREHRAMLQALQRALRELGARP